MKGRDKESERVEGAGGGCSYVFLEEARRRRRTSNVSVYALRRAMKGDEEGEGGGIGCRAGCRERSRYATPRSQRLEKGKRTRGETRDVGRRRGEERYRRRRGEGGRERERGGRVRAGMEGRRRRGGSDGVNCRRQGHRLYLAGTADTRLWRYTRTIYSSCVAFLSFSLSLSLSPSSPILPSSASNLAQRSYVYARVHTAMMCVQTRGGPMRELA